MLADYLPILVLFVLVTLVGLVAVNIPRFVAPRRPSLAKLAPYESGMSPVGPAWRRVPIRFYLTAMLFVLFDVSRFGSEIFRASPRQADLMIVAGRVSQKMAPVLRQLYDQMPEPKWVIAMGACASCGGVYNNYALVQGVDKIVPVDVFLAGCPPRPEALIFALMQLHEMVER